MRSLDELLDRMATGYEGQRRFAANAFHELRTPWPCKASWCSPKATAV
jgi:hypothetical protein